MYKYLIDSTDEGNILRAKELGQISAISTGVFIIGPTLGAILYKYDKRLPTTAAGIFFILNIIICIAYIPKNICNINNNKQIDNKNDYNNNEIEQISLMKKISNAISNPLIRNIFVIRIFIHFIQTSMSARNYIDYYELKFNIETHIRGYHESFVMLIAVLTQTFLVLPMLNYFPSNNSKSQFQLISILLIIISFSSFIEYKVSSFNVYLICSLIPSIIANTLIVESTRSN